MKEFPDNPFRPGAGHPPPYLAGRGAEIDVFEKLLAQQPITDNLVLTGLRGVGKTVLLDALKPRAQKAEWRWVGSDLSEAASINEENITTRILTDLSFITSAYSFSAGDKRKIGFGTVIESKSHRLDYSVLRAIFDATPGLIADKLKSVLELAWHTIKDDAKGVVFAYDEAQNMSDHLAKEQFPLSLLLEVFQSIQRKGVKFMLVLVGLPTLFPKLVESRTYAERMFKVLFLNKLTAKESEEAIRKPLEPLGNIIPDDRSIELIAKTSGGYPYFIQFICREVYDIWIASYQKSGKTKGIPVADIVRKLDTDFFDGRWAKPSARQKDLLRVIAELGHCDDEFSVQEIVEAAKNSDVKAFSPSHANQILSALIDQGLVYKNRHGKYCFAVPLFGEYIKRQSARAA